MPTTHGAHMMRARLRRGQPCTPLTWANVLNRSHGGASPGLAGPGPLPGTAGQPAASRPPVQVIVAAVMRLAGQDVPPPARVLRNPAMTPGVPAEGTRRVPIPTPAPGRVPPHSAAPACSPPETPPAG